MKILGIDTSGYTNAIGVTSDSGILADLSFDARTNSLEQIVDNIDKALESAGLTLEDIEGIGVGLGPGSWTGIRVGVTTGKILAFSSGKPVGGISTLEALAYPVRDQSAQIVSVIGAGTGANVYAAFYQTGGENLGMTGDYFYGDIGELLRMITEPTVLVVSGGDTYKYIINEKTGHKVVEANPNGAIVALMAGKRFQNGDADDALSLTPLYLKESTAKAYVNKYISKNKD